MVFVTTSHSSRRAEDAARAICAAQNWQFMPRHGRPLHRLLSEIPAKGILVVGENTVVYWTKGGRRLFFHPGLAKTRIRSLSTGQKDPVAEALDLARGDLVVDANLGLATDALVIAAVTRSSVLGIEVDPLIAFLTRTGLQTYPFERYFPEGRALAQQIQVICADHTDVLHTLGDKSCDAVYFSPMFVKPRKVCDDRMPLREVAPPQFVTAEAIRQALRVARKRVAIKVNRDRPTRLPIPEGYTVMGGRRAYAQYIVYAP